MNPSDSAAEALPGMPCPEPSQAVPAAEAAVTPTHVAAMVACEGGGLRPSGHAPVAFRANLGAVQAIIQGTEDVFKAHGEKALRANCGGILAKDEACIGGGSDRE